MDKNVDKNYLKQKFFRKVRELRNKGHYVEVYQAEHFDTANPRPFMRVNNKEELSLNLQNGEWCLNFIFPPTVSINNPKSNSDVSGAQKARTKLH